MLTRREFVLTCALSALAAGWAASTQSFQVYRYWDSDEYFLMAQQMAAGETVTASAPYAYRVLTPWIVSRCCSADIQSGFLAVNLLAGVATALLLGVWLRQFVSSAGIRLLIVAGVVLHWLGPIRFSFYYPVYVDPLFQLLVVAALIASERLRQSLTVGNALAYGALVVLGTLGRELMLIVPACALLAATIDRRSRTLRLSWQAMALVAGLAAYLLVRASVDPRQTDYSFADALVAQLTRKRPESLILTWFLAFGPIVAILAYDWRATLMFLRQRLDLAALLVQCTLLAYLGGTDTERLVLWSTPVVAVLVAQSLERHRRLVQGAAVATTLAAGQLLSERVLWPVPDPGSAVRALGETQWSDRLYAIANRVFVIDDFHWNLWSYFGSRPFHLVQLAFYLALSAGVVLLMKRRAEALKVTSR